MAEHRGPGIHGNTITVAAATPTIVVDAEPYHRVVYVQNVSSNYVEIGQEGAADQNATRLAGSIFQVWGPIPLMPLQKLSAYNDTSIVELRILVMQTSW